MRGRFLTALALTGIALASAVTLAGPAAAAPAAEAAAALPFDVNGPWTDNGTAKPSITVANGTVFIDMSYINRPNAVGSVLDGSRILVHFSDDNALIGTFQSPTFLQWSNGSTWQKVYTGPQLFELEGAWAAGNQFAANIGQGNGFIDLDLDGLDGSAPHAVGYFRSSTTIRVSFPNGTVVNGTLQAPNLINWSNGTQWRRTGPIFIPPGAPECLRTDSLLC